MKFRFRILSYTLILSALPLLAEPPAVDLKAFHTGSFEMPVYMIQAPTGDEFYVVEQPGRIQILRNGKIETNSFLDIRKRVRSGGEMGLLSVAFHPKFASNKRYFVNYTTGDSLRTQISEFIGDRERVLLSFEQPFQNHNGGQILFGPDKMLYIGTGDGGKYGDPYNHAQNTTSLLGKILRINVDAGTPYSIPQDNPLKSPARAEIFAFGLRNPWRFSFDKLDGRLFAADVGQDAFEEVHIVERGKNYGWKIMEGNHCYSPVQNCNKTGLELPIHEYSHTDGKSITGGYVYRGTKIPQLKGQYIFGDYVSGMIWRLEQRGSSWTRHTLFARRGAISSFAEDRDGELYVILHTGKIFKIVPKS